MSPHSFRHTHASLLFEAQATMKDVQNRLGHSDIKTTMDVYTHVTKNSEKQAIDKLAKYANFKFGIQNGIHFSVRIGISSVSTY